MNYYCQWCDKRVPVEEAEKRIVDNTFTAPYGDTFISGGDEYSVEICPECGEDLEEIAE